MNNCKHYVLILFGFIFISTTSAQEVLRNVIVEHFTNTRCSVCANRNPAFYDALHQNPGIIHIAYHPSSPYSSCLFSTQNKSQNDARTRFYDIFGSTPRFIINGNEISGNLITNSTVYNEFRNQTTPVYLEVTLAKAGEDNIEVSFEVDIKSNNTIGNVNYFVALVEDTVLYNAPNGETVHHDVFRKSLSNNELPAFMIPQNEGNKFNFKDTFKKEPFWNESGLYAIVILTDADKKVVQVARSPLYNPNIVSSAENEKEKENFVIYPNPVHNELFIPSNQRDPIQKVKIVNTTGQKLFESFPKENPTSVNTAFLIPGTYFLEVTLENRISVQKFIKI
jgi:hypothetical protein